MNKIKRFFGRWKADYDFKTYISASGSLAVTLIFAFYNGFLGIRHASLWYGAICIYYILLTVLRGSIVAAAKRIGIFGSTLHFRQGKGKKNEPDAEQGMSCD